MHFDRFIPNELIFTIAYLGLIQYPYSSNHDVLKILNSDCILFSKE